MLDTISHTPEHVCPLIFIADVHAGKLATALRMLGFDCAYKNNLGKEEIAAIAEKENRIVLTRDAGLLKNKKVGRGYWLQSQMPDAQLKEVMMQFKLNGKTRPFTRCLECNGLVVPVEKGKVQAALPPKTILYFNEFYQCSGCGKVYWKGSHYEHMLTKIEGVLK